MSQLRETPQAVSEPKSPRARAFWRLGRFHFLFLPVVALVCLVLGTPVRGDTISGTVKDPSGALVTGDFDYYYVVYFKDDTYDFENLAYKIWSAKKLTLRTDRA